MCYGLQGATGVLGVRVGNLKAILFASPKSEEAMGILIIKKQIKLNIVVYIGGIPD